MAGADLRLVMLTTSAISRYSDAGHPSNGQRISLRIHLHAVCCSTPTTKAARTGHAMRLVAYRLQSPVDRLGRAGSCASKLPLLLVLLASCFGSSLGEASGASCLTRCLVRGFAVLLRCVHYPYLDIRVNRKSKINIRMWVFNSRICTLQKVQIWIIVCE